MAFTEDRLDNTPPEGSLRLSPSHTLSQLWPQLLVGWSPSGLKAQAGGRGGEVVLVCLFHVPLLKASLPFNHSSVLEIALWQVLGAGREALGWLTKERNKTGKRFQQHQGLQKRHTPQIVLLCPFYRWDLRLQECWLRAEHTELGLWAS